MSFNMMNRNEGSFHNWARNVSVVSSPHIRVADINAQRSSSPIVIDNSNEIQVDLKSESPGVTMPISTSIPQIPSWLTEEKLRSIIREEVMKTIQSFHEELDKKRNTPNPINNSSTWAYAHNSVVSPPNANLSALAPHKK